MRKYLHLAVLLLCMRLPAAQADEAWQLVYEDASLSASIDTANISRQAQMVIFREREILHKPELDPATMRKIQETQYRLQVNCTSRRLRELSRAVFSEQGALMHYEATSPAKAHWEAPQSEKDLKLLEAVCGPA
jgi:hypothetical protein